MFQKYVTFKTIFVLYKATTWRPYEIRNCHIASSLTAVTKITN